RPARQSLMPLGRPFRAATLARLLGVAMLGDLSGSRSALAADDRNREIAAPFPAPRYTREVMESSLSASERWRFVYGTRDSSTAGALRDRALWIVRRWFGGDTSRVTADRVTGRAELESGPVVLLGGPRENEWTRRLEATLPVRFSARGFHWA